MLRLNNVSGSFFNLGISRGRQWYFRRLDVAPMGINLLLYFLVYPVLLASLHYVLLSSLAHWDVS